MFDDSSSDEGYMDRYVDRLVNRCTERDKNRIDLQSVVLKKIQSTGVYRANLP